MLFMTCCAGPPLFYRLLMGILKASKGSHGVVYKIVQQGIHTMAVAVFFI